MRIAIFDGSFETTAFIRRLIKGLVRAGHKVYVLGFNEELKHPIDKVHYIPLGSNQSKWRFLSTWFANTLKHKDVVQRVSMLFSGQKKLIQQKNLDDFIRREEPEIIHVQWPSLIVWIEKHLKLFKPKFIVSHRGFQTNVKPNVDEIFKKQLKRVFPDLDGVHSVSKAISKEGKTISSPASRIDRVIYTGLNLKEFEFSDSTPKNNVIKLITVGRPHWKKGYDIALKAIKILTERRENVQYSIIGGKGDEELLFLINEFGLHDKVHLYDRMPQDDIFKLMREKELFLLPSLEEGIANVAVEAMALGVPVISTNCGGMKELITHEEEGWIVPTRDPEAIAKAIMNFIKLPEERIHKVRTNARIKVEKQHSEEKMIHDMEALYKEILEN